MTPDSVFLEDTKMTLFVSLSEVQTHLLRKTYDPPKKSFSEQMNSTM